MMTAKEQLAHLATCLSEHEAETLLAAAEKLCMIAPMACPSCGQAALDLLAWTDDEAIVCETCKTTFDPNAPGPLGRSPWSSQDR